MRTLVSTTVPGVEYGRSRGKNDRGFPGGPLYPPGQSLGRESQRETNSTPRRDPRHRTRYRDDWVVCLDVSESSLHSADVPCPPGRVLPLPIGTVSEGLVHSLPSSHRPSPTNRTPQRPGGPDVSKFPHVLSQRPNLQSPRR